MELAQKDLEKIEAIKEKAKDLIDDQAAKVLVEMETYTSRVTSHQDASSGNIEQAVTASRNARDATLEAKSNAVIKIDNIVKNAQVKN